MLREVLRLVESVDGPISLTAISRELDIDPGVVEEMLNYWVRKGRLTLDGRSSVCSGNCAAATCQCGSCTGISSCPFIARLPKTYMIGSAALELPLISQHDA